MTKKAKQYCSCTKQISTGTQVSQVPSSNHIIESDDEDIIQHLEEKASNAIWWRTEWLGLWYLPIQPQKCELVHDLKTILQQKILKVSGVLVFFDRFVDVTSLDNITNVVKGKSNVDAAIVNVAETKSYY